MSKAGEKIIEGLNEAVKIAKCEHAYQFSGFNKRSRRLWVYGYCPKCQGTFTAHVSTPLYDLIKAAPPVFPELYQRGG